MKVTRFWVSNDESEYSADEYYKVKAYGIVLVWFSVGGEGSYDYEYYEYGYGCGKCGEVSYYGCELWCV